MATTAVSLHLRTTKTRSVRNPNLLHFFSSSSTPNPDDQNATASPPPPPPQPQSPFSSYFSDVKASLKQQPPPPHHRQPRPPNNPPSFSSLLSGKPESKAASLGEILKNLNEYRRRSAAPPPPSSSPIPPSQPVSFQELYNYKRNVIPRGEEQREQNQQSSDSASLSFDKICDSLNRMRSNKKPEGAGNMSTGTLSLQMFQDSRRLRPVDRIGGTELPLAALGSGERSSQAKTAARRMEFLKSYGYSELGAKLRKLRPEASKGGKKERFSLAELNERLIKLREMEAQEQENELRTGSGVFTALRDILVQINASEEEKKKRSVQRIDVLSHLGGTPNFMLGPPKEILVEKYFHPDNMSSSEKLKLELEKVRDEFKMSESDCGSSRVQGKNGNMGLGGHKLPVEQQEAQLTTKIKHLSSTLHKKDDHSRKGLQAMIERRKKLSTYLRKTDWDSYCLVLSKLGLRDRNPNEKKYMQTGPKKKDSGGVKRSKKLKKSKGGRQKI